MTEFGTTALVLFRVGCSWPPKDPDTNCVGIFCGFLEKYVCPLSMADTRSERRMVKVLVPVRWFEADTAKCCIACTSR